MTKEQTSSKWKNIYSKYSAAPIELKAFCLFATIVTILSILLLFANSNLRRSIVPITGLPFAIGYSFGLYFIYAVIFSSNKSIRRIKIRYGILMPLVLSILLGGFNLLNYNTQNFGNPYLTISKWQPIWTILIPLFWIILLMSKRVTRFCLATS